ncbi:hypothetical protein P152DRAFT_403320 [Eremomyces bilateralis CBS 781.70]|uniref:Sin3 binding protein-domain-containing protein n=1 Tax=Eremomyces bilateralis CBS 781.70 TaxID=1392243 RepID=A0A6G1FTY9_9PEZI|nr:uncharacterized protein P152DRAFT_403320 [Eremomyces bilateralis CBS 781.70]KAF1809355.1 hypothetical protein P152DRAFT_403320 [Eremomyces bilateralis CBS 781.70]
MLPTPPNSISPTLPPHKGRTNPPPGSDHPPAIRLDSDSGNASETPAEPPQALSSAALSGLEAAGAISPSMLATHHLPDILLNNGPVAIRHVLSHLTQTVPGFSRIAPPKARRIVVAALEGRAGGGHHGEVVFEKVGWGRWDARYRDQPPKERRDLDHHGSHHLSGFDGALGASPPASTSGSYAMSNAGGLQIPKARWGFNGRGVGSWGADDSVLSYHEEEMLDMHMAEHEADKMSLDGSVHDGSSVEPDDDLPIMDDDLGEETDEEDWAGIGAEALYERSNMSTSGYRNYNQLSRSCTARVKPSVGYPGTRRPSCISKASSGRVHLFHSSRHASRVPSGSHPGNKATAAHSASPNPPPATNATVSNSQERAAIEALLSLGSM